ncbi:phosphatase PAP2 family protein [Kitasatospora sp. NPDC004289]
MTVRRPARTAFLALALLYLAAAWTPLGQRAENALIVGYADGARILPAVESWGPPPLVHEYATLAAALTVIAVLTVARRSWREGAAAVLTVAGTLGTAELAGKTLLPRPDLVGAEQQLLAASFPSGHVAIAAALALGLALVTPERQRPHVAAAGALWVAVTAGAVQALYWHRPSDVLGAVLLACGVRLAAGRLLLPTLTDPGTAVRLPALRAPLLLAVPVAYAAASRQDGLLRPLAFALAAWLCAVLTLRTSLLTSRVDHPRGARRTPTEERP